MRGTAGVLTALIGLAGCSQIEIFDSTQVAACTSYAKARAISGPSFKRVGVEEWDESIMEEELDRLRPEPPVELPGTPGLHLVGIQYEDLNPQGIPIDGLAQICAFETRNGELPSDTSIESGARMAESTARLRDLADMGHLEGVPTSAQVDMRKYPCCL